MVRGSMARAFPKKPPSPTNTVALPYVEKTATVQAYLPEIFKGIGASMRHFFSNTRDMLRSSRPDPVTERWAEGITTISYPEQKRPYPERFRGVHRLTARDDGSPRCVACLCCSTACPAHGIFIEAGKHPPAASGRRSDGDPLRLAIDDLRRILRGDSVQ